MPCYFMHASQIFSFRLQYISNVYCLNFELYFIYLLCTKNRVWHMFETVKWWYKKFHCRLQIVDGCNRLKYFWINLDVRRTVENHWYHWKAFPVSNLICDKNGKVSRNSSSLVMYVFSFQWVKPNSLEWNRMGRMRPPSRQIPGSPVDAIHRFSIRIAG